MRNQRVACMLRRMTPERIAEHELVIEAPAGLVWEALTSPGGLDDWLGAGTDLDLVPGGHIVTPDVVSDRPRRGLVDDVDLERRFSFTWWPEDDPHDRSHVTITLEPVEPGTMVRVVERAGQETPPAARPAAALASDAMPGPASVEWPWRASLLSVGVGDACARR